MPRLIDTNVMLASNAHSKGFPKEADITPSDINLRKHVFEYLEEFSNSNDSIVLDIDSHIENEYEGRMGSLQSSYPQEFGMIMLQNKKDSDQVAWVSIEVDHEGFGVIDAGLAPLQIDKADRKWVAAAKYHFQYEGFFPSIAYAGETDWYKCQEDLKKHGFCFHQLLPNEWYDAILAGKRKGK